MTNCVLSCLSNVGNITKYFLKKVPKSVVKGVFSGLYCCFGNRLCCENDNTAFTNGWTDFDTMNVASSDKEWL